MGVKVIIPGRPTGKKSVRSFGKIHYNPQAKEMESVRGMMSTQVDGVVAGDIRVDWEFGFEVPKSWSKSRRLAALDGFCAVKPDLSNLLKFYEDCGNGVLWEDDKQIVVTSAKKVYAEQPYTKLDISVLC